MTEQHLLEQLRLRSDAELYAEAISFAAENELPDTKQMVGLLEFSRSWKMLMQYVKHQRQRDWEQKRAHYGDFYKKLAEYLDAKNTGLRDRARTKWVFVDASLPKKQLEEHLDRWAGLLAREFIQHLCAAAEYKSKLERAGKAQEANSDNEYHGN